MWLDTYHNLPQSNNERGKNAKLDGKDGNKYGDLSFKKEGCLNFAV